MWCTCPVRPLRPPRATRRFLAEPVADDDLERILDAGRWAGSARNRQPWRFVVFRDAGLRGELARLGAYAQHLASAPLVIGLAVDEDSGSDAHFDVGRAAQALMSAAGALGYGTCPATLFPEANVNRAGRLAGAHPPWRMRWAIAVGRAAPPLPPRRGRPAIATGRLPRDAVVREAGWPRS
jgi:nitroreductase